jgi:hypothetical protein
MTTINNATLPNNVKTLRPLNDVVYTDPTFAKRIIDHFTPQLYGSILEPCKGGGAFYDQFPAGMPKEFCEISEGLDFLDYCNPVDWIITNFPWSSKAYNTCINHAFNVSDNVVSLCRMHNTLGTNKRIRDARNANHFLKEIILCDWKEAGFPAEGFQLGVFHFQRNYTGGTFWTDWT